MKRKLVAMLACILSAGCADMTFHFVGLNGTWEYTPVVSEQKCTWHMPSGVLTIFGERGNNDNNRPPIRFSWSSLNVTYSGVYSLTEWDGTVLLGDFFATPKEMSFIEHGSSSAIVEGHMENKDLLVGTMNVTATNSCTYKATWTARRLSGP